MRSSPRGPSVRCRRVDDFAFRRDGLFADSIEQLAAESITGGCGGGDYCPGNPVTRGQMAVFLVKTFDLH